MSRKWLTISACLGALLVMLLACAPASTESTTPPQAQTTVAPVKDTTPPALSITQPANNSATGTAASTVAGTTEKTAKLTINGTAVTIGADGSFSFALNLVAGKNTISVSSIDAAGNKTNQVVYVTYNPPPPPPPPPAPTAPVYQQQQQSAPSADVTVYITRTGECYHSAGCRYLSKSCIPISLSAAKQNYRP
jgi:hypothetical protein